MDTVSSMDAVSRRQVLGGMAVGVAAVGAVVAGLDSAAGTVAGVALGVDADVALNPVTRPLCSADWAAVCFQTPSTSL